MPSDQIITELFCEFWKNPDPTPKKVIPKYGFLNNKSFSHELSASLNWIWKDGNDIPDNFVGYVDNNSISLHKIKDSDDYKIICCNTNFNLKGKIFITDENNFKGFCLLNSS